MEDQDHINVWVVDLDDQELSKINVESREEQEEQWDKPSIYKLPASCFMADPRHNKTYMPQTVSFGPYHSGDEHLKKMEYHKHRVLRHFLRRSGKTLRNLVDTFKENQVLVQQLLDSYDSIDEKWQRDENGFLKLMILDGCFMLEILQWSYKAADDDSDDPYEYYNYARNDPIFSHHGRLNCMTHIRKDMLMLENQLPMLLLNTLLAIETKKSKEDMTDLENHLNKIILKFCSNIDLENPKFGTCLHVLDLYRKSLLIKSQNSVNYDRNNQPPNRQSGEEKIIKDQQQGGIKINDKLHSSKSTGKRINNRRSSICNKLTIGGWRIVQSANNLNDAGIEFEISESNSLEDITFQGGVLRLPEVFIDDTTESTYLNLMAFERFHVGTGNEISSYVCFMDNLIDSAKDVKILRQSKIVDSAMGSDKAVANLFNEIAKDVTPEAGVNLNQVQSDLNAYCETKWHEWRANLTHTYFRNPWALISLLAAIFLLALTFLQTFYSIYSYHYETPPTRSTTPSPPRLRHWGH